jgi:predicted ester cyclase
MCRHGDAFQQIHEGEIRGPRSGFKSRGNASEVGGSKRGRRVDLAGQETGPQRCARAGSSPRSLQTTRSVSPCLPRSVPSPFSAQAGALSDVHTLQAYTDWMKGLFGPIPDGQNEIRSFAVDEERRNVAAYGVFRGTHTGDGGPVPPTRKRVEADYVYVMQFEGNKIHHMTKIWNDSISLKQLGWA